MVPGAAASGPPGNLLEMQILRPHSRPADRNSGDGTQQSALTSPPDDSDACYHWNLDSCKVPASPPQPHHHLLYTRLYILLIQQICTGYPLCARYYLCAIITIVNGPFFPVIFPNDCLQRHKKADDTD